MVVAVVAYFVAVAISRPEFLRGFAPALPEPEHQNKKLPPEVLMDPAVQAAREQILRSMERGGAGSIQAPADPGIAPLAPDTGQGLLPPNGATNAPAPLPGAAEPLNSPSP